MAGFLLVTAVVVTGVGGPIDARSWTTLTHLDVPGTAHRTAAIVVVGGQIWVVGPILLLASGAAARRSGSWRPLAVSLGAFAALDVLVWLVKFTLGRTAPHSGLDLLGAGGLSYPSGHAAQALLVALLVTALQRRRPRQLRTLVDVVAGAIAVVVGLTTLVLGYHWPSDVLGSWFLAVAVAVVARRLLDAGEPGADRSSS